MDEKLLIKSKLQEDFLHTKSAIAFQKATIQRLEDSNLEVSGAEINLAEMNEHLELIQKNLGVIEDLKETSTI